MRCCRKRENDRVLSRILHNHRRRNHFKDRVHLLRHVGTLLEGHPREMLRGRAYSRPFPYRRENEQSPRRSPRRRIAPHDERRPDTATEEVALAPAQAKREPEG